MLPDWLLVETWPLEQEEDAWGGGLIWRERRSQEQEIGISMQRKRTTCPSNLEEAQEAVPRGGSKIMKEKGTGRKQQYYSEGENCYGILGCGLHSCCHKTGDNPSQRQNSEIAAFLIWRQFPDSSPLAKEDCYLNENLTNPTSCVWPR